MANRSRHARSWEGGFGTGQITRREWSRSSAVEGWAMTNCDMAPSRLVTVQPCSRTSDSQEVALNRPRSTADAPAMRVA